MTISDRIRVKDVRVLSHEHYVLKAVTFGYRRGVWRMADLASRSL